MYLKLNLKLFKSNGRNEFILGLTKDKKYRQNILDAIELTEFDMWEPFELKINEKSRFIIAFEYCYSNPNDEFCENPDYNSNILHLYEMSFEEVCKFLGEKVIYKLNQKILGISLLKDYDSLASRLGIDGGNGWSEID